MSSSNSTSISVVERVYDYTPNKAAAGAVGALYALIAFGLFFQLFRHRSYWGLCLPIGAMVMSAGLFVRIPTANNPYSLGLFIVQNLMTVLSPAAFLAFNYIVYGRLVRLSVGPKYSAVNAAKVAQFFVLSDVITFLIQSGGGGLEASAGSASLGADIFLVGLVLQMLSYLIFVFFLIRTHISVKKSGEFSGREKWWRIFHLLHFSSVCILIRCAYRVVEGAQGHSGYLITHEVYFYVLDVHPLAWAIGIYIFFWPSNYIGSSVYNPVTRDSEMALK